MTKTFFLFKLQEQITGAFYHFKRISFCRGMMTQMTSTLGKFDLLMNMQWVKKNIFIKSSPNDKTKIMFSLSAQCLCKLNLASILVLPLVSVWILKCLQLNDGNYLYKLLKAQRRLCNPIWKRTQRYCVPREEAMGTFSHRLFWCCDIGGCVWYPTSIKCLRRSSRRYSRKIRLYHIFQRGSGTQNVPRSVWRANVA